MRVFVASKSGVADTPLTREDIDNSDDFLSITLSLLVDPEVVTILNSALASASGLNRRIARNGF